MEGVVGIVDSTQIGVLGVSNIFGLHRFELCNQRFRRRQGNHQRSLAGEHLANFVDLPDLMAE
jgi:hypothetical protein